MGLTFAGCFSAQEEVLPCPAGEGDVGEIVTTSFCEDDRTIYTEEECKSFASFLGVSYQWGGTFDTRWEPRGCFVSSNGFLFVNSFKSRTGNKCGFSSTKCVCKTGCNTCPENSYSTAKDRHCKHCPAAEPSTIAIKGAESEEQCHERSWKSESLRGSLPKWRRLREK